MIAATIPARTATIVNTTIVPTGSENVAAELVERLGHQRREADPERDAERGADQRGDDALVRGPCGAPGGASSRPRAACRARACARRRRARACSPSRRATRSPTARAARRAGSGRRSSQARARLDELVLRLHLRVREGCDAPRSSPSDDGASTNVRSPRPRERRVERRVATIDVAEQRVELAAARRRRGRRPSTCSPDGVSIATASPIREALVLGEVVADDRAVARRAARALRPSPASTRSGSPSAIVAGSTPSRRRRGRPGASRRSLRTAETSATPSRRRAPRRPRPAIGRPAVLRGDDVVGRRSGADRRLVRGPQAAAEHGDERRRARARSSARPRLPPCAPGSARRSPARAGRPRRRAAPPASRRTRRADARAAARAARRRRRARATPKPIAEQPLRRVDARRRAARRRAAAAPSPTRASAATSVRRDSRFERARRPRGRPRSAGCGWRGRPARCRRRASRRRRRASETIDGPRRTTEPGCGRSRSSAANSARQPLARARRRARRRRPRRRTPTTRPRPPPSAAPDGARRRASEGSRARASAARP